jgi:hypothetical protein
MLTSGCGHKPALILQPHNFVCADPGADANNRSSGCRFPSGRPGGYALRTALSVNPRTASALKPSNPQTPFSSGASGTENLIFIRCPKLCLAPSAKTAAEPGKDLGFKRSGQAGCSRLRPVKKQLYRHLRTNQPAWLSALKPGPKGCRWAQRL